MLAASTGRAINPDIFGSMIQAVAEDEERGELGMHYTSVPNILKVLNPLFLDDLRAQLEEAGDNPRKLLNLRKRLGRIRVFDPACGSGNFLVIAYKEMRAIEAEILARRMKVLSAESRDREDLRSVIPLKNFFGIELKDFACEIARLSLLIAEYQCDVDAMGQERAGEIVLPLKETGRIQHGNALRLDWLEVCPPPEQASPVEEDLAGPTGRLALETGEGGDWETYICGNPPYIGYNKQSANQKADIKHVFEGRAKGYGKLDYVSCWLSKAAELSLVCGSSAAFVTTNSICQGSQVPPLWSYLYSKNQEIFFARTSFKWANLAANNAGITVIVVGIRPSKNSVKELYDERDGVETKREVASIGPYLIPNTTVIVEASRSSISGLPEMRLGNHPYYASELIFSSEQLLDLIAEAPTIERYIRPYYGSSEYISGVKRHCLWIKDEEAALLANNDVVSEIFQKVSDERRKKKNDKTAQALIDRPYRFRDQLEADRSIIVVPQVTSENRNFLPVGILSGDSIISFQAYGLMDSPVWSLSIVCSRLHWNWISKICRRMRTDFSYSSTLGWNTFPVPRLTEKNKADLTRCAEDILLAREHYFPATIADMYDPDRMDEEFPLVREAHERNDETLERIYIGRRFKNDTERLEKLFDLYTKMTAAEDAA